MMTPKEILIAARAKIEAPERWTQGAFARSVLTNEVKPASPRAKCWCMLGAIGAALRVDDPGQFKDAYTALFHVVGANDEPGFPPRVIAEWNDAPGRTHAEVLAAFDRAIAAADSA